jgi:hypothetical protein
VARIAAKEETETSAISAPSDILQLLFTEMKVAFILSSQPA